MPLTKRNNALLEQYRVLLGIAPQNWPFNAQGGYALNTIQRLINGFWGQYHFLFNNTPVNVKLDANPIESHPYINHFPITGGRDLLVIGTFPPFSYVTESATLPIFPSILCNTLLGVQRIENIYNSPYLGIRPDVLYYYGNKGSFWDYVPNLKNPLNLGACHTWQEEYRTNISDIIAFCQRKNLTNPSDSNLYNIIPNFEIVKSIIESEEIETVLFTSGKPDANYLNNQKDNTFSIFFKCLVSMGVTYQFGLFNLPAFTNNINPVLNKALFKLRLVLQGKEKIINVVCLPSPSGSASRRMAHHPFYHTWSNGFVNGLPPTPTNIFRSHVYGLAFNRNFGALDALQ